MNFLDIGPLPKLPDNYENTPCDCFSPDHARNLFALRPPRFALEAPPLIFGRPVRRFILAVKRQLPRLAAIRQHFPDFVCPGAR